MTEPWDTPDSSAMRRFVAILLADLTAKADLLQAVMDGDADFEERTRTVLEALSDIGGVREQALYEVAMHAVDAGLSYETIGKWAGVPWGVLKSDTEEYRRYMSEDDGQ